MAEFHNFIIELPGYIQGALGSALCLLLLKVMRTIAGFLSKTILGLSAKSEHNRLWRKYIYLKYTSSGGLFYYAQGYLITFYYVLRYMFYVFIFCVLAIMIAGFNPIVKGICIVATLYFLLKGLIWLEPEKKIKSANTRWRAIAEIEKLLYGKVDSDTEEFIEKFSNNEEK